MNKKVVFYFGADYPWFQLLESGFRRRNTFILKALKESDLTIKVYAVRRAPKNKFLHYLKSVDSHPDIKDVFFFSLLPDRYFKKLNQLLARWQVILQVGRKTFFNKNKIIWSYWPRGFREADYLSLKGRWIFDSDHNIVDDPNLAIEDRPERIKLMENIGAQCDILISSSRSMLRWFEERGFHQTKLLMNGVDINRFSTASAKELIDISRPVIGYVGTLSSWINYNWLFKMIGDHSDWNFVIAGPPYKFDAYLQLGVYKNVSLIGDQNPSEVPALMKSFDVGIGLYSNRPGMDVNSMKLYEYLASGIPVVVNSYHPDLSSDFNQLIHIAESYKDFISKIEDCLKKERKENEGILSTFLIQSTWQNRIDCFLKSIKV